MKSTRALDREKLTRLLLAAIVLLGLALRLAFPTLAEFKGDESTVARRALAIAHFEDLPAWGVGASVGVANPPLFLYLMALPLRLWSDPIAAVLFVGLLNGLAVLACYALGRSWFNARVGLIAAFLFAVCPWAVLYGRKIWSQNLPLITLGFIAALLAGFVRGRPRAQLLAWLGLAALIGLHLGGLAFVPILGLALLLNLRRLAPRHALIAGPLLCGVTYLPYLWSDARQGWPNLLGLFHYGYSSGAGTKAFSWEALRYAFQLTGSAGIEGQSGARHAEFLAGLPNLWGLNSVMMGLLALALLYAFFQALRGPEERRRPLQILLLWFAVPVLLQSRTATPTQPHYFILLYPVQFLLIALLLDAILTRLPSRSPALTALLLLPAFLWAGWQIAVVARLFTFMAHYPGTGGYGIPLRFPRAAALEARRLAQDDEIIILADSADPVTNESAAAFEALLYTVPHRLVDGREALPIPDASAAVYLTGALRDDGALDATLAELTGWDSVTPGPEIALPDGIARYRIFRRAAPDREETLAGLTRFPGGFPFANNVVFAAVRIPPAAHPGETVPLDLAWWLRAAPPAGQDYHFYVHLIGADGHRYAQSDSAPFPTARWRPMDLVRQRFPLALPADLPPGTYRLRAGLYSYPDILGVPVIDPQGTPIDDAVTLGELVIPTQ